MSGSPMDWLKFLQKVDQTPWANWVAGMLPRPDTHRFLSLGAYKRSCLSWNTLYNSEIEDSNDSKVSGNWYQTLWECVSFCAFSAAIVPWERALLFAVFKQLVQFLNNSPWKKWLNMSFTDLYLPVYCDIKWQTSTKKQKLGTTFDLPHIYLSATAWSLIYICYLHDYDNHLCIIQGLIKK